MKNFTLAISLLASIILVSCKNDDYNNDIQRPDVAAYATAALTEDGDDFYYIFDSGKTAYVEDGSYVGKYFPEDGQRSIICFDWSEDTMEGYDHSIILFDVTHIFLGESLVVETEEELDAIPDNSFSFIYKDMSLTESHLNIIANFMTQNIEQSEFYLVECPEAAEYGKDDDYLYLELRFKRGGAESYAPRHERYISFKTAPFEEQLEDKKGIILRMRTLQSGVVTATVDRQYADAE